MATLNKSVICIRGTLEYKKFLAQLVEKVKRECPDVTTANKLALLGIQALAISYGMDSPPHAIPRSRRTKRPS